MTQTIINNNNQKLKKKKIKNLVPVRFEPTLLMGMGLTPNALDPSAKVPSYIL